MASTSFHLEDASREVQNLPLPSTNQSLVRIPYKCSPKEQEKEFLQLYIKAKAKDYQGQTKQKLRSQHSPFSAKIPKINHDENQNDEVLSPKTAGNPIARRGVLKNIDINNLSNTLTPSKPSKFKPNHESNIVAEEKVEEIKISAFDSSYRNNNRSLHEIEFKDENNASHCPASIDILLPTLKENHSQTSDDLEANNVQSPEDGIETRQRQDEPINEQRIQQEHENQNHQTQSQVHGSALIDTNTRSTANPIIFSSDVETVYMKTFKVYLVWFLSYGVLLGFNFGIFPYFVVLMFALLFESYFVYEIWKEDGQPQEFDSLPQKKKLNCTFQVLSIILLEILGVLKYIGIDFPLSLATIPIFLTTIFSCYIYTSGDRRNSNSVNVAFQVLLSLQILMICLKVDSILQWSWQGTFWVSWALLALTLLYCIGLSVVFLFFLCFEESNATRSYQLAGLVWILSGLSGSVGVLFFLLYGFTDRLEYGTDQDKISKALIAGMTHVLFLAAYTWFVKTKIKKFLRRIVRADIQIEQQAIPKMRFEKATEGFPSYIVRFTSSYFLTFDDSLKVKDGLKLKNLKKKVNLMKLYQYRKLIPEILMKGKEKLGISKPESLPLVENDRNLYVDELKTKKSLPKKFKASEIDSPTNLKSKPKYYGSEVKKRLEKPEEIPEIEEERNEKLCFSANDIDFLQKMENSDFLSEVKTPLRLTKKVASEKEDERACIICFDHFADAVVMGCGHGGICYGCALESWKKSQECFMCRGKIDKILHIDIDKLRQFNITKVLSAKKMVRDESNTHGYRYTENFADAMHLARNQI